MVNKVKSHLVSKMCLRNIDLLLVENRAKLKTVFTAEPNVVEVGLDPTPPITLTLTPYPNSNQQDALQHGTTHITTHLSSLKHTELSPSPGLLIQLHTGRNCWIRSHSTTWTFGSAARVTYKTCLKKCFCLYLSHL